MNALSLFRYCAVAYQVSLLLCLSLSISACFKQDEATIEYSGKTMGTTYRVVMVAPPGDLDAQTSQAAVEAELARINGLMSNWDTNSELSLFNQATGTEWVETSPDTIELLKVAKRISKETNGAYDVTLGSVSKLWGFQPVKASSGEMIKPDMDEVLTLMYSVGHQLIQVSKDEQSIRKLSPELQLDLSSIAKGFAVDRLGELIESQQVSRYLIDIGGEIRTRGLAADGERWKVGIEWPVAGVKNAPAGVMVDNSHIATSGDYRNYKEIDGERFSHLLDGRSGYPISHRVASVTVLHGSVAQADAWSTALMVLGLEEGLPLAKRKGLAARFTVRDGAGFRVVTTPAFDAYSFTAK